MSVTSCNPLNDIEPKTLPSPSAPSHEPVAYSLGPDGPSFTAFGDRILVEEDEFKSGLECAKCNGSGKIVCPDCGGHGTRSIEGGPEKKCSTCGGSVAVDTLTSYIRCPDCEGKGGLLVVPDTAQRRPTTGVIVSAGEKVQVLKVGQSVLYSNFAGYVIDLARAGKPVTLRILHETEVLAGISGHLTLTNLKGKSEIAVFNG